MDETQFMVSSKGVRINLLHSVCLKHHVVFSFSQVPANDGRSKPYPRALHTAVGTKAYMVVYGGIPNDEWKWRGAGVSPMSIFVYSCGLWVNSMFKAFKIVIKVVEYVSG